MRTAIILSTIIFIVFLEGMAEANGYVVPEMSQGLIKGTFTALIIFSVADVIDFFRD